MVIAHSKVQLITKDRSALTAYGLNVQQHIVIQGKYALWFDGTGVIHLVVSRHKSTEDIT